MDSPPSSSTSSRPLGWARCLDNVADVLRRGAWYPIIEETTDGKVVIEVRKRPVRVSRVDVAVRNVAPDRWSIVVRTGILRPTLGGREGTDTTTTYAVCPHCQERQPPRHPREQDQVDRGKCCRDQHENRRHIESQQDISSGSRGKQMINAACR
jgi:hypothetical protein